MKILLIGETFNPYSKVYSYKKSFESLGHRVGIINVSRFYSLNILNRIINWFLFIPRYFCSVEVNNKIIERANIFDPDLIFFHKPLQIKPQTIKILKNKGIKVFSWTGDSIFYRKNVSQKYLKSLPLYDCNFFQNSINIKEADKYDSKRSEYLPSAIDKEVHYPVEVSSKEKKQWGADIVFIGTYSRKEKRGRWLERLCEEGYDIKVYGNRWGRCLQCFCLRKRGRIAYKAFYAEDFSRIINSSKIVINFLREHNKDSHNSRTFEIPACGGFMLHEKNRDEATTFLKKGEEAEFFSSYKEMKKKIDYYLENDKKRKEIAKSGYEKVQKKDCSFDARAEKVLEVYKLFNI